MYADVVFPVRLKPLTYKVPDNLKDCKPGCIVKAPLQGKLNYGLVFSLRDDYIETKNIQHINEIACNFASKTLIEFLLWMSKYYLSSEGIALRSSFFKEAVELINKKKVYLPTNLHNPRASVDVALTSNNSFSNDPACGALISEIFRLVSEVSYKTILVQSEKGSIEQELLLEVIKRTGVYRRGIIVIAPEINEVKSLYKTLVSIFANRIGMFHSNMRASDRRNTLEGILRGDIDILVGTRSVLFAPLKGIALIVVISEHSDSYKAEEGLRYNARDASVMLGYMHNCPVVLSSISPSIESVYNGKIKKYNYYVLSNKSRCKIIPVLHNFKRQLKSALSKEVLSEAKRIIESGGFFLFLVPREGYSLLYCTDCGNVARCKNCGSSLIFSQESKILLCNHCNKKDCVPAACEYCNGFNISPIGGGIERIKGEMESLFRTYNKTEVPDIGQSLESLIIKKGAEPLKRLDVDIDGAAIIDFDYLIHRFGFRAQERAFQDALKIASIVKPKGTCFIQTNNPSSILVKSLKSYDYNLFYEYELSLRRSAGYPPFKKLIAMDVYISGTFTDADTLKVIGDLAEGIELLGPLELDINNKPYDRALRLIFRATNKGTMDGFVRDAQRRLQAIKGIKTTIEVDPLKL